MNLLMIGYVLSPILVFTLWIYFELGDKKKWVRVTSGLATVILVSVMYSGYSVHQVIAQAKFYKSLVIKAGKELDEQNCDAAKETLSKGLE